MLSIGEKVYVISRRLFETDSRNHFIGEIQDKSDVAIQVKGYSFSYNHLKNAFVRRDEIAEHIVSITNPYMIILLVPPEVSIENIHFRTDANNKRIITDERSFSMVMTEFGATS